MEHLTALPYGTIHRGKASNVGTILVEGNQHHEKRKLKTLVSFSVFSIHPSDREGEKSLQLSGGSALGVKLQNSSSLLFHSFSTPPCSCRANKCKRITYLPDYVH